MAHEPDPEIAVQPSIASGGTTVDVTGTCGLEAAGTTISIGVGGGIEGGIVASDIRTDDDGDFTASFTLPSDGPTGEADVFATCGQGSDATPSASLTIVGGERENRSSADTVVARGDRGRLVAFWQDRLNDWFALSGGSTDLDVDGIFGPRTEAATVEFQEATDAVGADAVVHPADRVALREAIDALESDETALDTVVARGDRGRLVAFWQDRLNDWFALSGGSTELEVDGIFGPRTEAATVEFQEATDAVGADAVVHPADRVALREAIDALESDETALDTVVARGDRGRLVAFWQDRLNDWFALSGGSTELEVDGIFGPRTEAATVEFQEATDAVQADGVVDPVDRVALREAIDASQKPTDDS